MEKNYLIFGGSAGIGKSCAKKILEDGNNVYIFSRERKKIIKLKKEFKKFKDKFFFCRGDIGKKKDKQRSNRYINFSKR